MKDFRFFDCALLNISHPTKIITNTVLNTRINQHRQVFPPDHFLIDRRHGSTELRSANTFRGQGQGQDILQTINTTFNIDRTLQSKSQFDSDIAGTVRRRSNTTIKQLPSGDRTASLLAGSVQAQSEKTIVPSATGNASGTTNQDRTIVVRTRTFNISSDRNAASPQADNLARITMIDIQGNNQAATNINNIAENQLNEVNNVKITRVATDETLVGSDIQVNNRVASSQADNLARITMIDIQDNNQATTNINNIAESQLNEVNNVKTIMRVATDETVAGSVSNGAVTNTGTAVHVVDSGEAGAVHQDSLNTLNAKVNFNEATHPVANTNIHNQENNIDFVDGTKTVDTNTFIGVGQQNMTLDSKTDALVGQNDNRNMTIERTYKNVSVQNNNYVGAADGNYNNVSQGYYDDSYYYYNDTGAFNDTYLYYDYSTNNYTETNNSFAANVTTENSQNVNKNNAVSSSNMVETAASNKQSGGNMGASLSVKSAILEKNVLDSSSRLDSSNTISEYQDIKTSFTAGNVNNRTHSSNNIRIANDTASINGTAVKSYLHKPEVSSSNVTSGFISSTSVNNAAAVNTSIVAQEIVSVPNKIIVLPELKTDNISVQYAVEHDSNQPSWENQDLKQSFDTANTQITNVHTMNTVEQTSSVTDGHNSLHPQNFAAGEATVNLQTTTVKDIPLGWNDVAITEEYSLVDINTSNNIFTLTDRANAIDSIATNVSNTVEDITTNLNPNEVTTEFSANQPIKRIFYSVSVADRRPKYAAVGTRQNSSNRSSNYVDLGVAVDSSNILTDTIQSHSTGFNTVGKIKQISGTSNVYETVQTDTSEFPPAVNNTELTRAIYQKSADPNRVYTENVSGGTINPSIFPEQMYTESLSTGSSDTSVIFRNINTENMQKQVPTISGGSETVYTNVSTGKHPVTPKFNRTIYTENLSSDSREPAGISIGRVSSNNLNMIGTERSAFPGRVYAEIPDLFTIRTFTKSPHMTGAGINTSEPNTFQEAKTKTVNNENIESTDSSKSEFSRISTPTSESLPNFSTDTMRPVYESVSTTSPNYKFDISTRAYDRYIGLPSTTVDPLDRMGSTFVRMVNYSEITSDSIVPAPTQDISSISDIITPGGRTNTESILMAMFSSTPSPRNNSKSNEDKSTLEYSVVEDKTSFSNLNFFSDSDTRVDRLGGVPVHSRQNNLNTMKAAKTDTLRLDSSASTSQIFRQNNADRNEFIPITNFDLTNTLDQRYNQVINQNSKEIISKSPVSGFAIPMGNFNSQINSAFDKTLNDSRWDALQVDNFTADTTEPVRHVNEGKLITVKTVANDKNNGQNMKTNYKGGESIVWQSMLLSNLSSFNEQPRVPLDTVIKSTKHVGISINSNADINKIKPSADIKANLVKSKAQNGLSHTRIGSANSKDISYSGNVDMNKMSSSANTNTQTFKTKTGNIHLNTLITSSKNVDNSINGYADVNKIASSTNANRNISTKNTAENMPFDTVKKSSHEIGISISGNNDINTIKSSRNVNTNTVTIKNENVPLDTVIKSTKMIDIGIKNNADNNNITPSTSTNTKIVMMKRENVPLDTAVKSKTNLDISINGNADINKITSIKNSKRQLVTAKIEQVPDVMPPIKAKSKKTFTSRFNYLNDREQNKLSADEILLPPRRKIGLFTPYLVTLGDRNQIVPNNKNSIIQSVGNNARVDTVNFSNTMFKGLTEPLKSTSASNNLGMSAIWDINRGNTDIEKTNGKSATPVPKKDNSDRYILYRLDSRNENTLHSTPNKQQKFGNAKSDMQIRAKTENKNQDDVNKRVLRTLEALVLELGAIDAKQSETKTPALTSSVYRDRQFHTDEIQSSYPLFSVHQRLLTIPRDVREWRYNQRNTGGLRGSESYRLSNMLGVSNLRNWNTDSKLNSEQSNINADKINNTSDIKRSKQAAVVNISGVKSKDSDLFAGLLNSFADISLGSSLQKPSQGKQTRIRETIVRDLEITTLSPAARGTDTQSANLTAPLDDRKDHTNKKEQAIIQSAGSTFFNPFTGENIALPGQGKHFTDTFIARGIGNLQHLRGIEKLYSSSVIPNLTVENYNFTPNAKLGSAISIQGKYLEGQMRRNEMGQFEPVPLASSFDTSSAEKYPPLETAVYKGNVTEQASNMHSKTNSASSKMKGVNTGQVHKEVNTNDHAGTIQFAETDRAVTKTLSSLKLFDINATKHNAETNNNREFGTLSGQDLYVSSQKLPSTDKYFFSQADLLKTNGISFNPTNLPSQSADSSPSVSENNTQSTIVDKTPSCKESEMFVCNAVGKNRDIPGMVWWCFSHCKNGVCPPEKCNCRCEKIREVPKVNNKNSANISVTKRKEKVIQLTLNKPKEDSVSVSEGSRRRLHTGITSRAKFRPFVLNAAVNKINQTSNSVIKSDVIKPELLGSQAPSTTLKCKGINAFADTTGIDELCTKMCSQNICPETICTCL